MLSEKQVQALVDGLQCDIELVKENYINGVIGSEQQFAILSYKRAQIEMLKVVLEEIHKA